MTNQEHITRLLDSIQTPEQLRELDESELPELASELREFLIATISQCGGHFAAGLGTVELTIALHYLLDTPHDRVIWDVGHQAYPHKVLTGRKELLKSIRQTNGLSPFPDPQESEYDSFAVGHSSTSISAALGMAIAARQQGIKRKVVAVIGDGAMTAGMALEAMNHASTCNIDMLVILNDNDMSISENVGGLNNYLSRIFSGKTYATFKDGHKKVFHSLPGINEFAHRVEEHLKGMVVPGTLFEELGFNYIGPIDGHDLPILLTTIRNMLNLTGCQLLHIGTRKGRGYPPAEADPIGYHGVANFDPTASSLPVKSGHAKTYSNIFGEWLCDMAKAEPTLAGITPAMREGSDMVEFSRQYPEQYFDVAIAEQHAVTLAAGMAKDGLKPVVAIYSSFLQRGYDQLIHDVCLQNLDVLFAIDRGGLVGGDGATHNGVFDLSFLRCIPNIMIMAPSDEDECRQMLYTGYHHKGTAAVRYPRGAGPGADVSQTMESLEIGKGRIVREGEKLAILSFGHLLPDALAAAEQLNATVADMRFVKPLDEDLILKLLNSHQYIMTVEENTILGGAGSGVNEFIATTGLQVAIKNVGIPDRFIQHGNSLDLKAEIALNQDGIIDAGQSLLNKNTA
ncbi:MAG: 1-deoxy-D-xylulose-5-phosphate synthase [Gammaproteobacteria bacterium]|nr:MAG: 1-deoxy-D-xylulose-5-phosphate synthase [Gammaproteobacteria bacterium]